MNDPSSRYHLDGLGGEYITATTTGFTNTTAGDGRRGSYSGGGGGAYGQYGGSARSRTSYPSMRPY
jgi:hypothetical protein